MTSSLEEENCQPMGAFYGKGARLKLDKKADDFLKFNFNNLHASFDYEIKISKFAAEVFKGVHCEEGNYFAYLIQIFVKSDNSLEPPFSDINIFFEKDLDDLIEYSIILPRLFKRHHRYALDLERDSVCTFGQFEQKVYLWKSNTGIL